MNKFILVFIFTLTLYATAFAQPINQTDWNTFTITTYYPAPYGVYRNMRLQPSDLPSAGVGPGVMYYNQTENMMKFYNNDTWVNMTGGGGGYWAQSGTSNIYTTNSSGNVGIGTTLPTQKLSVNGTIQTLGASGGIMFPDGSVQTKAGNLSCTYTSVSNTSTGQCYANIGCPAGYTPPYIRTGCSGYSQKRAPCTDGIVYDMAVPATPNNCVWRTYCTGVVIDCGAFITCCRLQ